jgi:hypothetical protein
MSDAAAIAAAESRAHRAEIAALESHVELVIARRRIAEIEAAQTKRKDTAATAAVRQLLTRGVIKSADVFHQHYFKAQFVSDAALIQLCLCQPFNQRKRATK